MKRLHLHLSVEDLDRSIRFYSALFAAEPTVRKPDYAKWLLDDPCVNLAISTRGKAAGLDHLGVQVDTRDELASVHARMRTAERPILEEPATTCCYARSEKAWIADPDGLAWEAFHTTGDSTVYGDGADLGPIRTRQPERGGCCASAPAS